MNEMAAATTDARHEFVTATVGLVHLRSVPVVSENGHDAFGKVSNSRRGRKPRCYRALSGVSFQNSVDVTTSPTTSDYHDDNWDHEMDRDDQASYHWTDQKMASGPTTTSVSPAGTVRVTFVHRTITDYSNRCVSDEDDDDGREEVLDDDDEDYDQSSASVTSYQAVKNSTNELGVSQSEHQEHIYDTPCSVDELYSDLLSDSDMSGLDLSIFEPGGNGSPTTAGQVTADKSIGGGVKAFIYRPPRPQRQLSRGKTFRERLTKPLQKFFHVPTPPAVDYLADRSDLNNSQSTTATTVVVTDLDRPAPLSGKKNTNDDNIPADRKRSRHLTSCCFLF